MDGLAQDDVTLVLVVAATTTVDVGVGGELETTVCTGFCWRSSCCFWGLRATGTLGSDTYRQKYDIE